MYFNTNKDIFDPKLKETLYFLVLVWKLNWGFNWKHYTCVYEYLKIRKALKTCFGNVI